jgi:hypothetical protein
MTRSKADEVLTQFDSLKRRILSRQSEGGWPYRHPMIYKTLREIFNQGLYTDAGESALKEVNSRIKRIYRRYRGEEKDGQSF